MPNNIPFWVDFVTGCVAGGTQVIIGQPFDTMKLRLQIQSQTQPKYSGMMDCFWQIKKYEGLLSFYKGSFLPLLASGVITSTRFIVFHKAIRYYDGEESKKNGQDTLSSLYLCGALAGAVACIFATPVEHSRLRVQKQGHGMAQVYSGSLDAAIKIQKEFGITGLYKGFVATVVRDAIFKGNFFFFFEIISRMLKYGNKEKVLGSAELLFAGSVTGILNWVFVYPFDTLKSVHQCDNLSNPVYKNYRHIAIHNYQTRGLISLYRGFSVTMARAIPVNSTTYYALETTKAFFKDRYKY